MQVVTQLRRNTPRTIKKDIYDVSLAYKTISVCLHGANCAVIPSFCGVRLYFNDPYFILAPCAVFPAGANEKSRNCFSLSLSVSCRHCECQEKFECALTVPGAAGCGLRWHDTIRRSFLEREHKKRGKKSP